MGLSQSLSMQTERARSPRRAGCVQNARREHMLYMAGLEVRVIAMAARHLSSENSNAVLGGR